jgi:tetratricopeptide (TPR) repeat protein
MEASGKTPEPAGIRETVVRSAAASVGDTAARARREYDAGQFNSVLQMLEPVLEAAERLEPAERRDDEVWTMVAIASAWTLLALAAVRSEKPDIGDKAANRAAAAFDQLRKEAFPLGQDALGDAVVAYYLARRVGDAAEVASRAAVKGARAETYLFGGLAEYDLGHHADATAALTQAEGVQGADLQQRRLEALVAALEALGPSRAQEAAAAYQELSRLHYRASRYREALAALDRALALGLRTPEALAEKGEILRLLGDRKMFDQALAAIEEALRLRPNYAWAHAVHGAALTTMGKPAAAEAALRRAIGLDANIADWHYRLGDVLRGLDRYEEALQSLDRALELNPNHVAAHARRGETLRCMDRPVEALAELNRALELAPQDTFALASKGETLKELGKQHWPEAEQALQQAVELSPSGYGFAETSLADLWLDWGREADALAGFDRALKNNPDYISALEGKAQTLLKLDKVEQGLGVTRRLLELDPESGWAHAVTGVFLFLNEDYPGSLRALQQGTELGPKIYWAQDALAEVYTWVVRFGPGEPPAPLLERALAATRKAVESSSDDLSYRTTLGNVLWMLGGARRAEAASEYERVVKAAEAAERLEFHPAAGAGWSALRLASLAPGAESRPLLGKAERFTLEALATKSARPTAAESIAAKLNLGLLMICSERFALGLREYDAAIALAVQYQELRVRRGLLGRASQLLKEALTDWPRLRESPHVERALGKLKVGYEASVPTPSSVG